MNHVSIIHFAKIIEMLFDLYFKVDFYCYGGDISVTVVTTSVDLQNCNGGDIIITPSKQLQFFIQKKK